MEITNKIKLLLAGLVSLLSFSVSVIYMFSGGDWFWPLLTFVWSTDTFFSIMDMGSE